MVAALGIYLLNQTQIKLNDPFVFLVMLQGGTKMRA